MYKRQALNRVHALAGYAEFQRPAPVSYTHLKTYDVNRWYRELITAMFKPLDRAGMRLIVRDFSYTADHQYAMVDAAKDVSEKIVMALKKTPHDYYPTFPDNPTVGNCGNLTQWIEFDTWGQYFGLGILPCSVAEDMKGRMKRYLEKGASGIMLRTDWERLYQGSTFNLSLIHIFLSIAMIALVYSTAKSVIGFFKKRNAKTM